MCSVTRNYGSYLQFMFEKAFCALGFSSDDNVDAENS